MRNAAVTALKGLCWLVSAAIAVAAFGVTMVWVTGWMWGVILNGAHGWKDTLGRGFGAIIAAPVAGLSAGMLAALVVGAPLYGLLRLIGAHDMVKRRPKPMTYPGAPPYPPPAYPPPPPGPYSQP